MTRDEILQMPFTKIYAHLSNDLGIIVFNDANDLNFAFKVQEKFKEIGLEEKYIDEIIDIVLAEKDKDWYDGPQVTNAGWFKIINATAEQRCKAALLAIAGENNG